MPDSRASACTSPGEDGCHQGTAIDYQVFPDAGVVLDRVTGLLWEADAEDRLVDQGAATRHCSDLAAAGYGDWRLPERVELVSLVDFGKTAAPSVDESVFRQASSVWRFWTATASIYDPSWYWHVSLLDGQVGYQGGTNISPVRCVRRCLPAPAPEGGYRTADGGGFVEDPRTLLQWQRPADGRTFRWEEALQYCNGLDADGGPWRLPSAKELATLVDTGRRAPATDPQVDVSGGYFWTSTRARDGQAFYVEFDDGYLGKDTPDGGLRVRCVR